MTDTMTPEQRHRCMSHIKGSGDEAGAEGAAVAVGAWVSVPTERQKCSRQAGHRAAALPHGDIRQRVLLARTRRKNA